mmetsp:Transcript_16231/g.37618  ORF Transcript_16231/g.37618 Transcript_16231/m.37618 type:complete len:226 (-) Transcript_16231:137-814(-)
MISFAAWAWALSRKRSSGSRSVEEPLLEACDLAQSRSSASSNESEAKQASCSGATEKPSDFQCLTSLVPEASCPKAQRRTGNLASDADTYDGSLASAVAFTMASKSSRRPKPLAPPPGEDSSSPSAERPPLASPLASPSALRAACSSCSRARDAPCPSNSDSASRTVASGVERLVRLLKGGGPPVPPGQVIACVASACVASAWAQAVSTLSRSRHSSRSAPSRAR